MYVRAVYVYSGGEVVVCSGKSVLWDPTERRGLGCSFKARDHITVIA